MPMMISGFVAVLMVQSAPIEDPIYAPPRWAERGVPEYLQPGEIPDPYFATVAGIAGRVTLDCLVTVAGRTEDCQIVSAAPPGLGFDRAALAQTPDFRFFPATRGGRPEEARVRFGVSFPADEWPPEINLDGWPRPPDSALEVMRPIAERLARIREAQEDIWHVDPDRAPAVTKLVDEVERELRAGRVEALALSLARTLTEEEASGLLDELDPIGALGRLDRVHLAAPESQNEEGRFQRMIRERYCAIYDCTIPPDPGI